MTNDQSIISVFLSDKQENNLFNEDGNAIDLEFKDWLTTQPLFADTDDVEYYIQYRIFLATQYGIFLVDDTNTLYGTKDKIAWLMLKI